MGEEAGGCPRLAGAPQHGDGRSAASAWPSPQDTRQLPGSVAAPCPPASVLNQVQGSSCCSPHPFLFQTRDYWFSSQVMLLLRTQNCHLYLSPSTARTPLCGCRCTLTLPHIPAPGLHQETVCVLIYVLFCFSVISKGVRR